MKIILVITNMRRRSVIFLSDSMKTLSLEETAQFSGKNNIENAYLVRGRSGQYLRSLPTVSDKDNLDSLSVTVADIIAYANRSRHFKSTDAISRYVAEYIASLAAAGKPYIETIDGDKAFASKVRDVIAAHKNYIKQAAEKFGIDQNLLGAIIIDEYVRMAPFEEVRDKFLLDILGRNVSVGVAQIKLETANNLIKNALYNPNAKDTKLPFRGNLKNADRRYLYRYVAPPEHNVRFAAAYIWRMIDLWSGMADLSRRPEIIGTLYSRGYGKPHPNPQSNSRGDQIAGEFYDLAKKWLR